MSFTADQNDWIQLAIIRDVFFVGFLFFIFGAMLMFTLYV